MTFVSASNSYLFCQLDQAFWSIYIYAYMVLHIYDPHSDSLEQKILKSQGKTEEYGF